jgi:putative membrane protein
VPIESWRQASPMAYNIGCTLSAHCSHHITLEQDMMHSTRRALAIAAAAAAGLMIQVDTAAQQQQPARAGSAASDKGAAASKLSRGDAGMLRDIAQANMAEIETARVALEKSQNADVKKFAQMMVDDHTKGLADVKALASAKGADLPDGVDAKHKANMVEFKTIKGDTFDKQYMKHAGVGDHEATLKLLKKTQAEAADADLKALATKMMPVVETHLKHAQGIAKK